MEYKAEIREIPEHIVYFKEYFITDINEFLEELKERNVLQELSDKVLLENPEIDLTEPDYNVILFIDGQYKEKNVQIEFCDAVTAFGKDTEEYQFRTVPTFMALNVLHKGPNEKQSEVYEYANKWIEQNGYEIVGSPRSRAIDGFWNRENEEDYLTEIQIPVEKI